MHSGVVKMFCGPLVTLYSGPASLVEFRDAFDRTVALFTRFFDPAMWVFSTVGDRNWSDALLVSGMTGSAGTATPGRPGCARIYGLDGTLAATVYDATMLGFYMDGALSAVVNRQFSDDIWAVSRVGDADWDACVCRLGIRETEGALI